MNYRVIKNDYFSIYDFHENTYIDFYGNKKDFKEYKQYITDIQEQLKELDQLNKEKKIRFLFYYVLKYIII